MKRVKKIMICAVLACLLIGGGAAAYYIPAAYVSLDVNPAIEYSVYVFGRVLSVKGVNDDGTEIICKIALKNLKSRSIEDAVSLTVAEIAQSGYLDGEGAGIVIAASAPNMKKADKLAQSLENAANAACEKNSREADVNAEAVGKAIVQEAKELGVTPGKLHLVEKMILSAGEDENLDKNEWLSKSVKEIMAEIKHNTEHEKNAGEVTQNQEMNKNSETYGSMSENMGEGSVSGPVGSGSMAGSSSEPPTDGTSGGEASGNGSGMSGSSGTEPPKYGSGKSSGSGGKR
jgi:hypothetical protein